MCGREARPAGTIWNLTKTVFQTIIFWSLFLFVLPALIFHAETKLGLATYRFNSEFFRIIGSALFLFASALALGSCFFLVVKGQGTPVPFGCPSRLVREGPYRYARNPMAVSGIVQGFAVGLYLGSPLVLIYVFLGFLAAEFVIRPWEEMDLESRFGDTYRTYRHNVRRWIPWFRSRTYR